MNSPRAKPGENKMIMKNDITNRADIQLLVDSFYDKVKKDDVIGYLFNDVAQVNWQHHLPRMYDFWENIIFQTGGFKGNPMVVHAQLHEKSPLSKEHFAHWQKLFLATVDELFEGDKAELAKQRARSIATMMLIKVASTNDPRSII
jgi:hemoglobin